MIGEMLNGASSGMSTPPPALPELENLIERSEWLRGQAGLEGEALRWHRTLGAERDRIVAEAEELATPRLRRIPFGALFLLCIRFLWFSLAALIGRFHFLGGSRRRYRGTPPVPRGNAAARRPTAAVRPRAPPSGARNISSRRAGRPTSNSAS